MNKLERTRPWMAVVTSPWIRMRYGYREVIGRIESGTEIKSEA